MPRFPARCSCPIVDFAHCSQSPASDWCPSFFQHHAFAPVASAVYSGSTWSLLWPSPPVGGKGHSGTSLDIPPSGYSFSLMGVYRQYLGLYLLPFAVLEDPHFTLSSVDTLFFFVLAAPTSCASRYFSVRWVRQDLFWMHFHVSCSSAAGALLMHCSVYPCCHLGLTDG